MAPSVYEQVSGRGAEVAAIEAALGRIAGAAALVLEGEAGIGKTAVWSAGVASARSRLVWVLTARPAEAEARLAYVSLTDLLESILDETLPQPARCRPARSALRDALPPRSARRQRERRHRLRTPLEAHVDPGVDQQRHLCLAANTWAELPQTDGNELPAGGTLMVCCDSHHAQTNISLIAARAGSAAMHRMLLRATDEQEVLRGILDLRPITGRVGFGGAERQLVRSHRQFGR